mgnify:CR=1 FL=1
MKQLIILFFSITLFGCATSHVAPPNIEYVSTPLNRPTMPDLEKVTGKVVLENKEKSWNPEYNSYLDMKPFEVREALSFYIDTQTSYLEIKKDAVKSW